MAEHKYFLTSYARSDATLGDTAPIILTLIPQGNSEIERIGDRMEGTSLECRFNSYLPASYSNQRHIAWRFVGFIWKEQAGPVSVPPVSDIFDPNITPATGAMHILQPFNHNKKIARKILWDKMWDNYMDGNGVSNNWYATQGNGVFVKKFVINLTKLKRRLNVVNFNPASTIGRNHIMFCLIVSTIGETASFNFGAQFKYTFVDG